MTSEFVKLVTSILWFGFAVSALCLFYKTIRDKLLPNLTSFSAMGVELSFVKESMDNAVKAGMEHDASLELAEKSSQWKIAVSQGDKERALNRVKQHLKILRDAQILWVDDHPENNLNERRMFRQLKTEIDIARNTKEALDMLKGGKYDLVISDMARDNEAPDDSKTAGLRFLKKFRETGKTTPVIFYIGVDDPEKGVPAQAFGITNRPDALLHLTLDALERTRH